MNTYIPQNCFNPHALLFQQFPTIFYSPQPSFVPEVKATFNNMGLSERKSAWQYKLLEQVESPSFQTRFEPSIIIRSNTELFQAETVRTPTSNQSKQDKPNKKKIIQKDSRNVASNLLRIFLKHVLELKFYDRLIRKMIDVRGFRCTAEEFHAWLDAFGINYKNYIRLTEIQRVLKDSQHQQMKAIFRMLLRQYTQGVGAEHCLTSRRINRTAHLMHMSGLRELLQQAMTK